jgi:RimJ/RimL family protein N-acetyltransferase
MMSPEISARLASWPAFLVPGSAQLRVQQAIAAREAGLALPLAVTRRSDNALVGWISASRAEAEPRRALLTYWIGAAFHGQGIMREAAPVALEATFRTLGVTEVRAAVQSDNLASRSILRGLGMRPLGPGRIWCSARGREEPCEWWSVLRADIPAAVMAAAFLPLPMAAVAAAG